ncbi:MAG: hypothetical protein ACRC6V_05130, partial [Bacteroidales bacterium]
ETYASLIYNYCPGSTSTMVQMGISPTSLIVPLKAGDKLKFNVRAVNSSTVRVYQAGHITIQEL